VAHLHGAARAWLLIFTPFGSKSAHRDERKERMTERKEKRVAICKRARRQKN